MDSRKFPLRSAAAVSMVAATLAFGLHATPAWALDTQISETLRGGVTVDGWGVVSSQAAFASGVLKIRIPRGGTVRRALLFTEIMQSPSDIASPGTPVPQVIVGSGTSAVTRNITGTPDLGRLFVTDVTSAVSGVVGNVAVGGTLDVPVQERGDRGARYTWPQLVSEVLVVTYEHPSAPPRNVLVLAGELAPNNVPQTLTLPNAVSNHCAAGQPGAEALALSVTVPWEYNACAVDNLNTVRLNGMVVSSLVGGNDDQLDSASVTCDGATAGLVTTGSFGGSESGASTLAGAPYGIDGDLVYGIPSGRSDDELWNVATILPDGIRTFPLAFAEPGTTRDEWISLVVIQTPARLGTDGDADADGVTDVTEQDCLRTDTDRDGVPDYLDTDSDNDCARDSTEPGAARVTVASRPDANCASGQRCDLTTGTCIADADPDTDGDGLRDSVERRIGTRVDLPDTDGDGLRDGLEIGADDTMPQDTDRDGMIDALDNDDDGDGVPTSTERPGGVSRNSDSDTAPDYLDPDDDGDTIDTRTENRLDGSANHDADRDGTPSYLDRDSDGDTVLDSVEGTRDTDTDGRPDFLDTDSDNDCLPDSAEPGAARTTPAAAPNANCTMAPRTVCDTRIGECVSATDPDTDGDGLRDSVETRLGTSPTNRDTDGDGVADGVEVEDPNLARDTDGDGMIDARDTDDDGDGLPTASELLDPNSPIDADGDGQPDYRDPDDDGDGLATIDERADDTSANGDLDRDGNSSWHDTDADGDTVPDRAEGRVDTDGDGARDYLDTDSDNDCAPDAAEPGVARTTPTAVPDRNCTDPARPVCDRRYGVCAPCVTESNGTSRGCEDSPRGRSCREDRMPGAATCGCSNDEECPSDLRCGTPTGICEARPVDGPDAGVADAGGDAGPTRPVDPGSRVAGTGLIACAVRRPGGAGDAAGSLAVLAGLSLAAAYRRRRSTKLV